MQTICLVMQRVDELIVSLEEILRHAGFEGEFRIFYKIEIAREYWVAHGNKVDFFLVEEFVLTEGDGVEFVRDLCEAGQSALLLSGFEVKGVPRFSKILSDGRSLLATIHEIHQSSRPSESA